MRRYVVEVHGLPDDVADVDVRAALASAVARLAPGALSVGTSGGRDHPAGGAQDPRGFSRGPVGPGHLSLAPPAAPATAGPLSQDPGR